MTANHREIAEKIADETLLGLKELPRSRAALIDAIESALDATSAPAPSKLTHQAILQGWAVCAWHGLRERCGSGRNLG